MDETTPLLPSATAEILADDRRILDGAVVNHKDIVDFDPNGDPENPQDWASSYKWGIVALLAIQAFAVTFTCISVVPVAQTIVDDLLSQGSSSNFVSSGISQNDDDKGKSNTGDMSASSAAVLLVTIWELGEALGALFIAPLSELYGRAPVMNVGNLLFVAFTAAGALSQNVRLLIAARALTGVAVVTNVLNPAIIGDLFPPEQRGAAMSLVQLSPLLGGAIGPAIAGLISQRVGWRANLWMSAVLGAGCEVLFLVLFRETYKVPILRRKAARLRRETGNGRLRTEFDVVREIHDGEQVEEVVVVVAGAGTGAGGNVGEAGKRRRRKAGSNSNNNWTLMAEAVLRPFVVLKSSFVLQIMSLYSGVLFSYFYTMSTSFPRLLQEGYGFTPAETGLSFITFSLGSLLSVALCNVFLDKIYIRLRDRHNGVGQPEYRLPLVILGILLFPLAILLYGWSAQWHLPPAVLLFSVVFLGGFMLMGFLPLMAYVVDAFGIYSASAVTAVIFTRCVLGTFMPLGVQPLSDLLGVGWAFTVFAAVSVATIPIPVMVFRYGYKWRQYSKYTRD